MVSNNEFHEMCMKKIHHKHNHHQTFKVAMYEMKVREGDFIKRIGDLEMEHNTLERNFHHVYEKISLMYERMNTLTAAEKT